MDKQKQRKRKLEKRLMNVLVDRNDSDQRRRYVKRWIYGESHSSRFKSKSVLKREQATKNFLMRLIPFT